MRLAASLWRAWQPTISSSSLRPALRQPCSAVLARRQPGSLVVGWVKAYSSDESSPRSSRFASDIEENKEQQSNAEERREEQAVYQSRFKQQREIELQEQAESEEPLFPERYPRLESNPERRSVASFLAEFEDELSAEPVVLSGRVHRKRRLGKKLVFFDIVNEFEKVQVMLNRAKCMPKKHNHAQFDLLVKLLQRGDHVSVTGIAGLTNQGERTLMATDLPQLLSPAMQPIPEKLTDSKTRALERHVDMLVNKQAVDVLRLRSEIVRFMREHFQSKRFLEMQTPILARNAGGAIARPFVTHATGFGDKDMALRVAPELWLKRLVIGGFDRVFEIGPSFRNEGIDATHNPEFTTCEFYSAYSNLSDLTKETEELIHGLAQHCQNLITEQLTSLPPIDLSRFIRPFKQVEFIPALQTAMRVRLPNLSTDDALPELLAVLKLAKISLPGEAPDSLPKLLDRLATVYLEPSSFKEPIFITHHPACMSPLSKSFLCPKTYQLVSARAELFIGGRELANMYEEENDPKEQQRKLNAHRSMVNLDNGEVGFLEPEPKEEDTLDNPEAEGTSDDLNTEDAAPLDQSFVKALEYGLPPTGGWGCGIERLVMLFSGASRISDCLTFGTLRNVVNISAEEEEKQKKGQ
ncbi:hypothetical protein S40288_02769 [Stachybotrys chartarum IBT 40288]|nr:hypothetical protein S40288_02769 [Stachybotrys chartarum IBT 40288]